MDVHRERLDRALLRVARLGRGLTTSRRAALTLAMTRVLGAAKPITGRRHLTLDAAMRRVLTTWRLSSDARKARLAESVGRLNAVSPLGVLARGYSVCRTDRGVVVRRPADAPVGTDVQVILAEGRLNCRVLHHSSGLKETLA